jgi:hypothetical protein
MPLRARTTEEATAARTKLATLVTDLRADITALQSAIAALPAPASRTAAQQRDALIMRCLIRVIRFHVISARATTAADLGNEPA